MRSLLTLALFTIGTAFAADPEAPSVTAYAVNINHPPKGAAKEIVSPEYTGVHIFANLPGKQIVCIDPAATKLTVTDDKGIVLVPEQKLNAVVSTSFTRSQARLYLAGQKAPSAGATRIKVKGEITFLCGVGEKTATVEKLRVKAGEKADVGPAALEVIPTTDRFAVKVRVASPVVKSVTFTNAAGQTLSRTLALGLTVADGKLTQNSTLMLPRNAEAVGVKIEYYEKIEAVKVAVDSETGVGP